MPIFKELLELKISGYLNDKTIDRLVRKYSKDSKNLFSRDELIAGYKMLVEEESIRQDKDIIQILKLKPGRTMSGVAPITVLTMPYKCPGKCIYCPQDREMPKSYLADEPGAQRALRNRFDPYAQVYNRLLALHKIGHDVSKAELIILGGTWSFYPLDYRIWFVLRCFKALNDFDPLDSTDSPIEPNDDWSVFALKAGKALSVKALWNELKTEQKKNETAACRNVGLVLETRPDYLNKSEIVRMRRLGCTKVQIGVQSLDDKILRMNKRGHSAMRTRQAFAMLRLAGFKIHAHWMPNLYGATPDSDKLDYTKLWDSGFQPDELKIYPTSIIKGTKLFELYQQKKYRPYEMSELKDLLKFSFEHTPRYCRLTRVVRDIPSHYISAGNKVTNLRQVVELEMAKEKKYCQCIRCREVKGGLIDKNDIGFEEIVYQNAVGEEHFLSYYLKKTDKILGFLRLFLPDRPAWSPKVQSFSVFELKGAAIIREVHVYGRVVAVGSASEGAAQHLGLGMKLLKKAEKLALKNGYKKISVISAVGTRGYYRKSGYSVESLYMSKDLI